MLKSVSALAAVLVGVVTAPAQGGVVVPQAPSSGHHFYDRPDFKPLGHNETLGDLNVTTYVSLPKGRYNKDTAVILLTDIFGFPKVDNFLLADDWAKAGFATYTPGYLLDDPFPVDGDLNNLNIWLQNHTEAVTTPLVLSVLDALKAEKGIKKIGVTGYCFGGLYVFRLAQNNTVQVTTTAHPSLLTIPEDPELLQAQSQVPLQIHSAELDTFLTPELAEQIDEVLVGYEPGYNRTNWKGVGHGFAVSANASDPVAVAAKEGAFKSAVNWIKTHLDDY